MSLFTLPSNGRYRKLSVALEGRNAFDVRERLLLDTVGKTFTFVVETKIPAGGKQTSSNLCLL